MKKIDEFKGKYYFLSNFSKDGFKVDGFYYKTNEHYFQAMKTLDPKERQKVRSAQSPSQSKKIGRRVTLRDNWDDLRVVAMYNGLKAKFKQNDHARKKLLATGDSILVEGNNWHDNTWGSCNCRRCSNKEGRNLLGKLLMIVRQEFRKEK